MNITTGNLYNKTQLEVRLKIKKGDKEGMSMVLDDNQKDGKRKKYAEKTGAQFPKTR